ncbi:hypothetical protein [Nocardia arizonensis]|uniref:hypothetical protein n=1 Tax=Nocardia arizonensis TaxID=1141647 RepID=UPI0012E2B0FB|nr:hypothetical protein [Nocardia arizonensis]
MPNTIVQAPRADRANEPGTHSDRRAATTRDADGLHDLLLPSQISSDLSGEYGEG